MYPITQRASAVIFHFVYLGSKHFSGQDFQFTYPFYLVFFFIIVKKVEKRSNNMRTISGFEVIYGLCLTPLR